MGRVVEDASLPPLQSGNGFQQFLLAAACHTGDAQNLSSPGQEGDVVQHPDALLVHHGEMFGLYPGVPVFCRRPVYVQGHGVAHHHLGKLLGIGLGGVHRADVLSLAQHRHLV